MPPEGLNDRQRRLLQTLVEAIDGENYTHFVAVQPFGGNGLSGTGPKAGGPHYMTRFANERTLTVNTTATGGNAALLNLGN